MGKYDDLVDAEAKLVTEAANRDGWPSLAAAYRELSPDVSYAAFRARVISGKSVIEAGTMQRSRRGRPRQGS